MAHQSIDSLNIVGSIGYSLLSWFGMSLFVWIYKLKPEHKWDIWFSLFEYVKTK